MAQHKNYTATDTVPNDIGTQVLLFRYLPGSSRKNHVKNAYIYIIWSILCWCWREPYTIDLRSAIQIPDPFRWSRYLGCFTVQMSSVKKTLSCFVMTKRIGGARDSVFVVFSSSLMQQLASHPNTPGAKQRVNF